MKVTVHGNNTSSMSQLVMNNVIRTVVQKSSNQKETTSTKNRKGKGGQVTRTRRGSDGFVKMSQMDQQHLVDLESIQASSANKKKQAIKL